VTQTLWRLIKTRYVSHGLSGEGARLFGGRWTSPGHSVIYCAQHLSLAILEILVHTDNKKMFSSYSKIAIEVEEEQIHHVSESELPDNWNDPFPGSELQEIGNQWLNSGESLILRIPSAVVHEEYNFLINTQHDEFDKINVKYMEPAALDMRLFGSSQKE
jgi:RES domain-containing protein